MPDFLDRHIENEEKLRRLRVAEEEAPASGGGLLDWDLVPLSVNAKAGAGIPTSAGPMSVEPLRIAWRDGLLYLAGGFLVDGLASGTTVTISNSGLEALPHIPDPSFDFYSSVPTVGEGSPGNQKPANLFPLSFAVVLHVPGPFTGPYVFTFAHTLYWPS